jgi:hypothetical protein
VLGASSAITGALESWADGSRVGADAAEGGKVFGTLLAELRNSIGCF